MATPERRELPEEFSTAYGPLTPIKWLYHRDQASAFLKGEDENIQPVTAYVVPTLLCNQRCYFCTFGGVKERLRKIVQPPGNSAGSSPKEFREMPLELMERTIDQLASVGIKGVTFTGGGEPTLYPHLCQAMEQCKDRGLDFALNTNGRLLNSEIVDRILPLNPTYIRVSINAGTREVQALISGIDDLDGVLSNVAMLAKKKIKFGVSTDVSVGFVANIVNSHDLMPLIRRVRKIEANLERENISGAIFSIQVRPVGNYEGSKFFSPQRIERIIDYLRERSGDRDADEFVRFMYQGKRCDSDTVDHVLETIENTAARFLSDTVSKMKLVYPKQKFIDIVKLPAKPYETCYALSWFLFVWPNGNIYPCVEWAGTPGFEVGNLLHERLSDLLASEKRKRVISRINTSILKERCAVICAHHELNLMLDEVRAHPECLSSEVCRDSLTRQRHKRLGPPQHVNFV